MATLNSVTGVYNVEASLVAWMVGELTAYTPALVSTVTVNLNYPEQPLTPPQWSIHFLGTTPDGSGYVGSSVGVGQAGERRFGMMEVNCWVSRESNPGWRAQLGQMRDAVTHAVHRQMKTGGAVLIYDFYTSQTAPQASAYRITLERVEDRTPPVDPNPDIERRRIIVYFNWIDRA